MFKILFLGAYSMTLRSSLLSSLSSHLIRPVGVGVMFLCVSVPAFAEDPVPRAPAVMPVTQAAPLDPQTGMLGTFEVLGHLPLQRAHAGAHAAS